MDHNESKGPSRPCARAVMPKKLGYSREVILSSYPRKVQCPTVSMIRRPFLK